MFGVGGLYRFGTGAGTGADKRNALRFDVTFRGAFDFGDEDGDRDTVDHTSVTLGYVRKF